jgi:eukaryotic-like serine/threonine-protein kinase
MFYSVPNLVGRTYGEAKSVLEANGVNLFVLSAQGVSDTVNSYIIDQDPKRYNEEGEPLRIRSGQFISVKLSTEKPVSPDSTSNNQPLQ